MGSTISNKTGLAGELRVMSELLLRGHNPAKSYLEDGADIILQNGTRIEVKSGHRCRGTYYISDRKKYQARRNYLFTIKGGGRKQAQNLGDCDFVILWCIDDDCFFILPASMVTGHAVGICNTLDDGRGRYIPYKNKWELLEVGQ